MSEESFQLFVNSTSKEIFEYICTNPGSYLVNVGESMNLDRMMVTRHLARLHEKGLVQKTVFKGMTIYSPKGLRSNDIEVAFSQLKNEYRKKIFLFVLDNPNCYQRMIINNIRGISERQIRRYIEGLVDAELISSRKEGKNVIYSIGKVGKKIVIGSIETIDPMVNMIREKLGREVHVSIKDNIVKIDLMNGESISFRLKQWMMMNLDEDYIYLNKYKLLGEGGEMVLIAIFGGCDSIAKIQKTTALPVPVIRAKMETLRRINLIADFEMKGNNIKITEKGKGVVKKILRIEENDDNEK